jgi:hypothetical protein
MDGSFAQIIMSSISRLDLSKVFSRADELSTVFRGRLCQVYDCMGALFTGAWRPGLHLALEAQFSRGCPGDTDGDAFLSEDNARPNRPKPENPFFPTTAKPALCPLGMADCIPMIAEAFRMAERASLNPKTIHYATEIQGRALDVLDCLEAVPAWAEKAPHYALHFTLSAGGPSAKGL